MKTEVMNERVVGSIIQEVRLFSHRAGGQEVFQCGILPLFNMLSFLPTHNVTWLTAPSIASYK